MLCICHFLHQVTFANGIAAVFKEKWQTKNSLTIKTDFIIIVPDSTSEWPYMKNCGRQSHYRRNWQWTVPSYNEYSAKERAGIGKYFAEGLWLLYPLRQLHNTCTLKLTPSCKFKHIIRNNFYLNRQYLVCQKFSFVFCQITLSPMFQYKLTTA